MPIVTVWLQDAKTQEDVATQWWDDGSGILQQIVRDSLELPSGVTPVTGTFSAPGESAALTPIPGRGFNVSVWGIAPTGWTGNGQLERSFDTGETWQIVDPNFLSLGGASTVSRVYTEPEAGVQYRLNFPTVSAGTVNYRLSQ